MVTVSVQNPMTGDELKLEDLKLGMHVSEVKDKICDHWKVPACCQKLFYQGELLDNDDLLGNHYKGEITSPAVELSLDMIVSVDELLKDLDRGTIPQILSCLQVLADLPRKGNAGVIAAVAEQLGHPDAGVRQAAMETLDKVAAAKKGDPNVITETIARLKNPSKTVKKFAEEVLNKVVVKGEEHIISTAIDQLNGSSEGSEWQDEDMRWTNMMILSWVAEQGHEASVAAVLAQLEHKSWFVCQTALPVLSKLSEKGDELVIAAVITKLDHDDEDIRKAAVEALTIVAQSGDDRVIAALQAQSEDEDDEDVQRAVSVALKKLTGRSSKQLAAARSQAAPSPYAHERPPCHQLAC